VRGRGPDGGRRAFILSRATKASIAAMATSARFESVGIISITLEVTLAVAMFGRVGSGVVDVTDAVLSTMVPTGVDAGTVP
jgi:hypothetical protein